jgi:hypothetical protein
MQEEQQEMSSSVKGEEARQKRKAMRKEWQHERSGSIRRSTT